MAHAGVEDGACNRAERRPQRARHLPLTSQLDSALSGILKGSTLMSTVQSPGDTQTESAQRRPALSQPSPAPYVPPVQRQVPPPIARGPTSLTMSALSSSENRGYLIAGIGGIVALLAFFGLPFVTVLIFSVTGMQFANSGLGATGALWLVPVAAVVAIGLSVWELYARSPRIGSYAVTGRAVALAILAGGVAGTVALLIVLFQAAFGLPALTSSYGITGVEVPGYGVQGALGLGFWVALLSTIAVGIGGYLGYRQPRPTATPTA